LTISLELRYDQCKRTQIQILKPIASERVSNKNYPIGNELKPSCNYFFQRPKQWLREAVLFVPIPTITLVRLNILRQLARTAHKRIIIWCDGFGFLWRRLLVNLRISLLLISKHICFLLHFSCSTRFKALTLKLNHTNW